MHPQLEAVIREFDEAEARLERLAAELPRDWWQRRPEAARWSIAECVAHLNLTADGYLPLLRRGIERAREVGGPPPRRYRRDFAGWLLWRTTGPPVRVRVRTTAPFIPGSVESPSALLASFRHGQVAQRDAVRQADGLPLGKVRVTSPFDARVRYNLYSCLTIIPRHQHRHLWQAEQVLAALRSGK
jgi:hypothetical protein